MCGVEETTKRVASIYLLMDLEGLFGPIALDVPGVVEGVTYSNDFSSPPFNFTQHLAVVLLRVNLDLTSHFIVLLLNV